MHKKLLRSLVFAPVLAAAVVFGTLSLSAHAATTTTVNVTAGKPSEFQFVLSKKSVPMGNVTFKFTDGGVIPHDFFVCSSNKGGSANTCTGKGTAVTSPGGHATITINFKKTGSYEYLCTVTGHALIGMKGDLKVIA